VGGQSSKEGRKLSCFGSSHGNGLEGAMSESFPKGAGEGTAEGLHGFKQEGEQAGVPSAPEADHGGAAKALVAQLASHVPVGPFLKMEAF
jgi:hypothetical protein